MHEHLSLHDIYEHLNASTNGDHVSAQQQMYEYRSLDEVRASLETSLDEFRTLRDLLSLRKALPDDVKNMLADAEAVVSVLTQFRLKLLQLHPEL